MTTIDPQTRRRLARTGLTALDETRACPGYTLYTPIFGSGTVYLLNLHGQEVHRWEIPYPPGLYGDLLPNGHLFYLGKLHDETWECFPSWHRFKGGILLEVDWHGHVVWEYRAPYHHHDARRTPSGGALYLAIERVPEALAARVQGACQAVPWRGCGPTSSSKSMQEGTGCGHGTPPAISMSRRIA